MCFLEGFISLSFCTFPLRVAGRAVILWVRSGEGPWVKAWEFPGCIQSFGTLSDLHIGKQRQFLLYITVSDGLSREMPRYFEFLEDFISYQLNYWYFGQMMIGTLPAFFSFYDLFCYLNRVTEKRGWRRRSFNYCSANCPGDFKSQHWVWMKLGARSFIWVFHKVGRGPNTWTISHCFPQAIRVLGCSRVAQAWTHTLTRCWCCKWSLTHYSLVLVLGCPHLIGSSCLRIKSLSIYCRLILTWFCLLIPSCPSVPMMLFC